MRLKEIRTAKGISQVQLAYELGTTQGTISAWENQIWTPTFSNLKKLSNVLGCTIDDLIDPETNNDSKGEESNG